MIIDKQGIEELMNIKTPFRKLHKHTLPFYLLLFLFFSNYILNISFVLHDSFKARQDLSIAFLAIGFIVAVFFLICKLSNPGHLKPKNSSGSNMFQILLRNKPADVCFDCKVLPSPFSWSSPTGPATARCATRACACTTTTAPGSPTVWGPATTGPSSPS